MVTGRKTLSEVSMTISNQINSVGLVLDIVGAILIFSFGVPRGAFMFLSAKIERDEKLSLLGAALLVLGFICQLISNFVTR